MGCCFSTPNSKPKPPQDGTKQHQQPHLGSHEQNRRIRIPQPVEEEYVKEVLSETSIFKPRQVPILKPQTKTQLPVIQPQEVPIKKALQLEQVSIVSETCSKGESFSTTTATTVTENREEKATTKRSNGTRNRKRSYAVDGRDRRPKAPAGSRPLRRRESDQFHRNSGQGTVLRSRSPSRGGRCQLRPPVMSGRRVPPAKDVAEENDSVSVTELLENPHVSLECFIFL